MEIQELHINRRSGKLASNQIVQFFKKDICDRRLLPGEKLPTSREIVAELGVSSQTVSQAISELEKAGYVKAVPGRGTFVADGVSVINNLKEKSSEKRKLKFTRIGIKGLIDPRGEELKDEYHSETARGFFSECKNLDLVGEVFVPKMVNMEPEEILSLMHESNCQGLIWPTPCNSELSKIEFLLKNNFPVVVTALSRVDSICSCIQGDLQHATFEISKYFVENKCESVMLFAHFDPNNNSSASGIRDYALPVGLKYGIEGGYEVLTGKSLGRVESYQGDFKGIGFSETIIKVLRKLSPDAGVFFSSAWQFHRLFEEKNKEAIELLKNRKVVVMGNRVFLVRLLSLIGDLDFQVLVMSPEEFVAAAVHKLASIIDGYKSNNRELIPLELTRFRDMDFINTISRFFIEKL